MTSVVRTALVTGPGGAGRTTAAAATALAAARRGRRTLLLSTDPWKASAEAALGLAYPPEDRSGDGAAPWSPPAQAAPGLWTARLDSGERLRDELIALQERGSSALDMLGAAPLDREELTALPGAAQLAFLRALRAIHDLPCRTDQGGDGAGLDLVVIDMPPTPETLALLALPGELRRYLRRLLPAERQAARALRPMLAQLVGVPMPAEWLYDTAVGWESDLATAQAVAESGATTLRIVVEPGPAAVEEFRIARVGAALRGYAIDAVIANRLLPTDSTDPWTASLSGQQQTALKVLYDERRAATALPGGTAAGDRAGFAICELPHLGRDPRGLDDLTALTEAADRAAQEPRNSGGSQEAPGPLAPSPVPGGARAREPWIVDNRLDDEGVLVWVLPLPGAERGELDLVRRGDELVVAAGPFRRIVPLPSALRRCTVSGAGLTDGVLRIRFTPDPALWPRTS